MKIKVLKFSAAFLAGALCVLGFAPFSLWLLPFLGAAFLFLHGKQGFFFSFLFGAGFFLFGVSWVFNSLKQFGGMPIILAGIATLLFCLTLALFYGIALFLFRRFNYFNAPFLFAAILTLLDYLRGNLFGGFPWLIFGYAQVNNIFLKYFLPFFGVYFLSFLTFFIGALLALSVIKKSVLYLTPIVFILVIGFSLQFIEWTKEKETPLSVLLIQNNISLEEKFNPNLFYHLIGNNLKTIDENPADLIIFPETELPRLWATLPDFIKKEFKNRAQNRHIVMGILGKNEKGYLNSAVHLNQHLESFYHKRHLVPFGEFVPPFFEWIMQKLNVPLGNFSTPEKENELFKINHHFASVNICYEDAFGAELKTAQNADFLMNLSNTIWFGKSLAQAQHLEIAKARAIENQKPFLKATNSGITAIILHNGKIKKQLPEFKKDILKGEIIPREGKTFYSIAGDFPILIFCFLIVIFHGQRRIFSKKSSVDRGKILF